MDKDERWRRLHTLSGGAVLGLFVVEHLLTNASALSGQAAYESVVGLIERSKLLPVFELIILIPLIFHAGYGISLLRDKTKTPESRVDRYRDRRFWGLQRASAIIVLLFVLGHLWELRIQRLFFGMSPDAFHTVLSAHLTWTWLGIPWIALGYLVGTAATIFHLANGLSAALVSWKVLVDEPRRRKALVTVLGVLLFLVGAATVIGFATGTRLLPGADADSAPCGTAVKPPAPPPSASH